MVRPRGCICDFNPSTTEGPEQDCPEHGDVRLYAQWLREALQILDDCVAKATDFGSQEGGFVAHYILPTGPIHRAIPLLQEYGMTVRPHIEAAALADAALDRVGSEVAGLRAALVLFEKLFADPDWEGQVSMGFAATFDQHLTERIIAAEDEKR